MNIAEAKKVMLRTHLAGLKNHTRAHSIHLESGPGLGKSDGTLQYAGELARVINKPVGVVQFMLATISSVDVRGFMMPIKTQDGLRTVFSQPPWYPDKLNAFVVDPAGMVHRPGRWQGESPDVGVLFLDEFSQADDEVKKPAAELVYKGNVGTCELPMGWRVISAGNRTTDRSGVMRELMFLVNRRCQLSIAPSLPAWLDYHNSLPTKLQPHYMVTSFAQRNPDVVFRDTVPDSTEPFATPRSICLMSDDLVAMRSNEDERAGKIPTDDISREVAIGWIGSAAAAQFYTHLKYADELPDIADVIKRPKEAKVPKGRDGQMVCAYMLSHHLDDTNAAPLFTYVRRLDVEMQVLAIRVMSAGDRAKHLDNAPDYVNWLNTHKDVLLASGS